MLSFVPISLTYTWSWWILCDTGIYFNYIFNIQQHPFLHLFQNLIICNLAPQFQITFHKAKVMLSRTQTCIEGSTNLLIKYKWNMESRITFDIKLKSIQCKEIYLRIMLLTIQFTYNIDIDSHNIDSRNDFQILTHKHTICNMHTYINKK